MASLPHVETLEQAAKLFNALVERVHEAQKQGRKLYTLDDKVELLLRSMHYDEELHLDLQHLLEDTTVATFKMGLAFRLADVQEGVEEIIHRPDPQAEKAFDLFSALHAISVVSAEGARQWHKRSIGDPTTIDNELPVLWELLEGALELHYNTAPAQLYPAMIYTLSAMQRAIERRHRALQDDAAPVT